MKIMYHLMWGDGTYSLVGLTTLTTSSVYLHVDTPEGGNIVFVFGQIFTGYLVKLSRFAVLPLFA